MGLIKAVQGSISSGLGDQWLEVLEAGDMSDKTLFTKAIKVRTNGSNQKGTSDIVSNGSVIHVYPNQFMFLLDGGRVVDYTAEEGYYTVNNSSAPSMLNGEFGASLRDVFNRIKFGGVTPQAQKAYFINLQEIKGIKFGTPGPLNYFDAFYNAELFIRAHGDYSIKVTNPLLFYEQVIPKNADSVDISDINDQYLSEFLQGFSAALNQMSAEGERISFLASKAPQLAQHMQSTLDEDWNQSRGFEIDHVGVASISYTDDSQTLINMRNQGAMMSDANVRAGYVQTTIAQGLGAAGSNEGGAGQAYMGVGLGMNAVGGLFNTTEQAASAQNAAKQQAAAGVGMATGGAAVWACPKCGAQNTGNFCTNCGTQKPAPAPSEGTWYCPQCGTKNEGNFCTNCGTQKPQA